MNKEIIFCNQEGFVHELYGENALEELQSLGIANPNNFDIQLRERYWVECNWEIVNSELEELFDYCDKWLIQIHQEPFDEQPGTWNYKVIGTWEELKELINLDSHWIQIVDSNDELEINASNERGLVTNYTVRKLNAFGQQKLEHEKYPRFNFFSYDLWEHYTVLAYFTRFRNGEDVTFKAMNGSETTMEVRHHE